MRERGLHSEVEGSRTLERSEVWGLGLGPVSAHGTRVGSGRRAGRRESG